MPEVKKTAADKDKAKSLAEFGNEMFTAALESMRDQLSPEEFEAMKSEGEAQIAEFKRENNIE